MKLVPKNVKRLAGNGARISVTLLVAGLGVVVTTAAAAASSAPDQKLQTVNDLDILSESVPSVDELPDSFAVQEHGSGGIVPESVRTLGESDYAYSVARDLAGDVCLLAVQEKTGFSASSCLPAAVAVDGEPLVLEVFDIQTGTAERAYLVEDGLDTRDLSGPWDVVTENLITLDIAAAPEEPLVLQSDEGQSVTLDVP